MRIKRSERARGRGIGDSVLGNMCLELPPQIGPDPPDRSEEEEERREGGVESCALLMHKDGHNSEDTILI